MGKAQPARAMSVPVIVAAPGTGSRVQKSTAALKSAASWLSEMTGDIACPLRERHPPRFFSADRTVLRVVTSQRNFSRTSHAHNRSNVQAPE
jgi:hypothetical protein